MARTTDEGWNFVTQELPRMGMRPEGFRRVKRQVIRRILHRIHQLGLGGFADYGRYLVDNPEERTVLDTFCRITISRFFRDRHIFEILRRRVLPELARKASGETGHAIRCLSVGSASGEEPYSLLLLWEQYLAEDFPGIIMDITGMDADPHMLHRARQGVYPAGALRDVPEETVTAFFTREGPAFKIRKTLSGRVRFLLCDVRREIPEGPYELILCRNLVYTYFDTDLQNKITKMLLERLVPGGFVVIGKKEHLLPVEINGTGAGSSTVFVKDTTGGRLMCFS